jgi:hypothetical protein
MRLSRETIQEYIDAIYRENKTILFDAPTGFGTAQSFMKPILEDLLSSPKRCLMVASMEAFVDNIQNSFWERLEEKVMGVQNVKHFGPSRSTVLEQVHQVVENRTKTSVLFKNGSLIEFKTAHKITELNNSEESDILYIDSTVSLKTFFISASRNIHTYLGYLLNSYKKVIIADRRIIESINKNGESQSEFMEKIKPNYKPLYSFTISKIEDLTIELRRMKLKQLRDRCMTI